MAAPRRLSASLIDPSKILLLMTVRITPHLRINLRIVSQTST